MELELYKIKRSMHHDVITSFWTMLSELTSKARNDNDPVLQHQVEAWHKQWNRMTGDNKQPDWGQQQDRPCDRLYTKAELEDYAAAKAEAAYEEAILRERG